jgi:hypothetical protein
MKSGESRQKYHTWHKEVTLKKMTSPYLAKTHEFKTAEIGIDAISSELIV